MNQCVILRVHYLDEQVRGLIQALHETQFKLYLFADERAQTISPDNVEKISVDEHLLDDLGVLSTSDAPRRCGDYAFYGALNQNETFDYYWCIEGDVYINYSDPRSFFEAYACDDSDLLADYISERSNEWYWYRTMSEHYQNVFGCIYPVVRLSRRAVRFLYEMRCRRTMEHRAHGKANRDWANDEAFTTTELVNNSFVVRNAPFFGNDVYPDLISWRGMRNADCDDRVYHSVFAGEKLYDKAVGHVGRMPEAHFYKLLSEVRAEFGHEAAQRLASIRRAHAQMAIAKRLASSRQWEAAIHRGNGAVVLFQEASDQDGVRGARNAVDRWRRKL